MEANAMLTYLREQVRDQIAAAGAPPPHPSGVSRLSLGGMADRRVYDDAFPDRGTRPLKSLFQAEVLPEGYTLVSWRYSSRGAGFFAWRALGPVCTVPVRAQ